MKDRLYDFFKLLSEYAFYCLLFFIPISKSMIEIAAGFAFLGFVGCKIIKPDFRFLATWPNTFLLLFFCFNALSLFNSGAYLDISLHSLCGKWMKYLAICVIIQDIACDQKINKRIIFVFSASALLTVFSGISQYFFGIEFLRHRSMTIMSSGGMHAMTSSFDHYNSFGGYLVVALSLVVALLMAGNPFNFNSGALSILAVLSIVAIILTYSRGSWLAIFISILFMYIFSKKRNKLLIPFFLIIAIMFLYPTLHERMLLSFKSEGDSDRFRYWSTAFSMIREHPFFGMGVGTFMANFPEHSPIKYLREAYAHNCYLQIWAETGIFSLISFMVFISMLIYQGIKKFIDTQDFFLFGLLCGIVGFLAHSLFEVNLYSLQLSVLFWALAGLIMGRSGITDERLAK